jgi:hypothetical protein
MAGLPVRVLESPFRRVKQLADAALKEMSATFDGMYAAGGRRFSCSSRTCSARGAIT